MSGKTIHSVSLDGHVSTSVVHDLSAVKTITLDAEACIWLVVGNTLRRFATNVTSEKTSFAADMLKMMGWVESGEVRRTVKFKVDNDEILADSLILSARSEYFNTMLTSNFREADSDVTIEVRDTTSVAFRAIIRYLSADILDLDDNTVIAVARLGDLYMLPEVSANTAAYCDKHIAVTNAVLWLSQCDEAGWVSSTSARIFEYLCKNLKDIRMQTPDMFHKLSHARLLEVIAMLD